MPSPDLTLWSAPELAASLGITARALRFYETKGLIRPRRAGTRRVYDHRDRGRLQVILRGKRLGFSLEDIRGYLELYDADPTRVSQLRRLDALVTERIGRLEQQQAALTQTLAELGDIQRQTREALRERSAGIESITAAGRGPLNTIRSRTDE